MLLPRTCASALDRSYKLILPPAPQVDVQLYVDAGGACGPACDNSVAFLSALAEAAGDAPSGAISITPHWLLLSECITPSGAGECAQHCVGKRYGLAVGVEG